MRGCMKGKCPEKDAEKTDVRAKEGARTLSSTLPFGRKRPGGEFWEPFWHLFSDVFVYRFCIDFSSTFYRFSVLLNLAKSDFYVGRVANFMVLQASFLIRF